MIVQKKFDVPDMDLKAIRNNIVSNLTKHLAVPVVMLEQAPKKPKYPFVSYKFIVSYNTSGQGHVSETVAVDSLDDRFESDLMEVAHYQPQITLSITAYSKDEMESVSVAQSAHDYFSHTGYYGMKEVNAVVVSTKAFGNRNTLIVGDYERRTGFDVIFRTTDRITRRLETIETYNIEDNLGG